MRWLLAAVGLAVVASGAVIIVSGHRSAVGTAPVRERDRWEARVDALTAAKLAEVALTREVARDGHRAVLRARAARMQLEVQRTLMRLDAVHRRLGGSPSIRSGDPAVARGPEPAASMPARTTRLTDDNRRLRALIAARTETAVLARVAAGTPELAGDDSLRDLASNDGRAAAALRALHARWFGD